VSVDETSDGLLDGSVSGIMGLGFQTIASTEALPWWQALLNANKFSSPLFSFWITRFIDVNNPSPTEPGGILTLGGTNSSLYTGNIDFVNMPSGTTPSFWLLSITSASLLFLENLFLTLNLTMLFLGLSVGGKAVSVTPGDSALSAIDTGTTLIGGPLTDVTNFWNAVPNSVALQGENEGYFAYREFDHFVEICFAKYPLACTTKLDVTISFGGNSWPINNDDMTIGKTNSGLCVGSLFVLSEGSSAVGGGGNPNWVIGDTFLVCHGLQR
jgi:cathepsin D